MFQLILCTCPDQSSAEMLARLIVAEQLAACVSILPGVQSIYQWQGAIETAQEHLLLIKSHQSHFERLSCCITTVHPYDVPEIIALPITEGSVEYLKWIDASLCRA